MHPDLIRFLFEKHILVNSTGPSPEECFPAAFALANRFGIRIEKGMELATRSMIPVAANCLGEYVTEPFYRGFPETVRQLTPEQRLFDQLLNYALTYGLNDFSEARHSLFEEPFERIAFREEVEQKSFVILTKEEALKELGVFVNAMLASTRPLSRDQFTIVTESIQFYGVPVETCASRDTAVRLLLQFRDVSYARFLRLPDVIRLVEIMNFDKTGEENIRKLNLPNRQRKFIAGVLDVILGRDVPQKDIRDCFEKRALWCGLLHHIHYAPESETGRAFVHDIRNAKANPSALAAFEKEMAAGNPAGAAETLRKLKGSGAVARNLNYLLSRCRTEEEVNRVMASLGTVSAVMSWQMLLQYRAYTDDGRVFRFVRFNRMQKHAETEEEQARRKSAVPENVRLLADICLRENLRKVLGQKKLGKIYMDKSMLRVALPLQDAASSSGYGVLPRGSRLPVPEGDKLRFFTYWEKMDDIDLSCFALDGAGNTLVEFSWRTGWDTSGSEAVTFSGDETSGYYGGSEYFDVDLEAFREEYPDARYLVFADNSYTGDDFCECDCTAGYMLREKMDSGEIFEPKTVQTSFRVDSPTTYAVLYALDLQERAIVWLNMDMVGRYTVAGEDDFSFILPYMNILDIASVWSLFEAKADELVKTPEEADLIVSDEVFPNLREGQKQIHSYDREKLLEYMNM